MAAERSEKEKCYAQMDLDRQGGRFWIETYYEMMLSETPIRITKNNAGKIPVRPFDHAKAIRYFQTKDPEHQDFSYKDQHCAVSHSLYNGMCLPTPVALLDSGHEFNFYGAHPLMVGQASCLSDDNRFKGCKLVDFNLQEIADGTNTVIGGVHLVCETCDYSFNTITLHSVLTRHKDLTREGKLPMHALLEIIAAVNLIHKCKAAPRMKILVIPDYSTYRMVKSLSEDHGLIIENRSMDFDELQKKFEDLTMKYEGLKVPADFDFGTNPAKPFKCTGEIPAIYRNQGNRKAFKLKHNKIGPSPNELFGMMETSSRDPNNLMIPQREIVTMDKEPVGLCNTDYGSSDDEVFYENNTHGWDGDSDEDPQKKPVENEEELLEKCKNMDRDKESCGFYIGE